MKIWKWVPCMSFQNGYCCHGGAGPDEQSFMGCYADAHNDWVASCWYRRWVADIRVFWRVVIIGWREGSSS